MARSTTLVGHWNSSFTCFRDWVRADVFKRLFDALSDDPDMEYAMVDATHCQSPPPRAGREKGTSQAIGRSKGGMTAKIVALTDALGSHRLKNGIRSSDYRLRPFRRGKVVP